MNPDSPSRPLPLSGRMSYAATDAAGQLVFCVISFYLLKFYTDVVGLSAATAGTILLIARLIDAIDAPIWGIVFDKTHSRWGKSRPWFLWLCLPFAVFGVLTFWAPDLSPTAKAIYSGTTYIICSILYTGINTPVTSILSALTPDPKERVVLTSFRMFGSKIGVLLVNATALPLVQLLGKGDDKRGFLLTMPIFAAGSVLLFLLAFRNLRETIVEEKKSMPVREGFRALKGNWPWIIIFSSSLCFWVAFISRISMVPYFFEYKWQHKELTALANSLDIVSLASILLLPWFCKWTSKSNIWLYGLIGSVISQFILLCRSRHGLHAAAVRRLDRGHHHQRRGDGDAVLPALRQRGLRRMENRRARRRPAHRARRRLLPQGRQRPGRRAARMDSRWHRLRREHHAIRQGAAGH